MNHGVCYGVLDLLDRQIVDVDEVLVGKVDDVELTDPADGSPPRAVALLLGPQAYGYRLGGRLGRWIAAVGTRAAGDGDPVRVPVELVAEFGVSIRLGVAVDDLDRPERLDRWLRERFVGRIPGADSAPE